MVIEILAVITAVWFLGMSFTVTLCVRDLRACMDVEENCRSKDVKNYYRIKSKRAVQSLKMAPLWPITVFDLRPTIKAVKKYRALFVNKR
jgi:hypothetical protein